MKKIKLLIVLLLSLFLFNPNCYASDRVYVRTTENLLLPGDVAVDETNINAIMKTPAIDASEKIYDFIGVFSDDEEKRLYNSISGYIDSTGFDVSIVLTRDLGGFSIDEYATNFYDYNNFMDDGVILVIYIGYAEPNIYMTNSGKQGSEVFSTYTDSRINEILQYIYKNIKAGKYYSACEDYIRILKEFYDNKGSKYKLNTKGVVVKKIPWLELAILSLTLTLIIEFVLINRLKNNNEVLSKDIYDSSLDLSTLIVKFESDNLVDTKLSKKK